MTLFNSSQLFQGHLDHDSTQQRDPQEQQMFLSFADISIAQTKTIENEKMIPYSII